MSRGQKLTLLLQGTVSRYRRYFGRGQRADARLYRVSLFVFLFSMSMLEGLDYDDMSAKIRKNYLAILLVNWQARLLPPSSPV